MEINNNIQETYCSFEVAKLLKEKGFKVVCEKCYSGEGKLYVLTVLGSKLEYQNYLSESSSSSCPTHALAIEWIRVNFGIIITTTPNSNLSEFAYHIYKDRYDVKKNPEGDCSGWKFNSPQEATEAALLYTLQNLIK